MTGKIDSSGRLLSLFCGAGGLDLGFEQAGFRIHSAYDKNAASIKSYNHNRNGSAGRQADVSALTMKVLDRDWGGVCAPLGVIGGPPCQSFSKANARFCEDDPRHELLLASAKLIIALNRRAPVSFFVFENVPEMNSPRSQQWLDKPLRRLRTAGFDVYQQVLLASDYGVPQTRKRLFLVGFNRSVYGGISWSWPSPKTKSNPLKVRDAIGDLPEPMHFSRGLDPSLFEVHPNHWCMTPKSKKFSKLGALAPGRNNQRSFKTLSWDKPSLTVAYGNREVHIHPGCHRRLSVFEAMRLQGFPDHYVLLGSLSAQIAQISEAVPPPLARAVAASVKNALTRKLLAVS